MTTLGKNSIGISFPINDSNEGFSYYYGIWKFKIYLQKNFFIIKFYS